MVADSYITRFLQGPASAGQLPNPTRSSVGYVTQDDIMYETLTPRENLWFASAFILPKLSKDTRNSVIEGVIEKLNLKKCASGLAWWQLQKVFRNALVHGKRHAIPRPFWSALIGG